MDDILEISEDGSFEIPSPNRKRIDPVSVREPTEEELERAALEIYSQNIFDDLETKEFHIYQRPTGLFVVVKLPDGVAPEAIAITNTNVLQIKAGKDCLNIELPEETKIIPGSIQSKYFQDICTITIPN